MGEYRIEVLLYQNAIAEMPDGTTCTDVLTIAKRSCDAPCASEQEARASLDALAGAFERIRALEAQLTGSVPFEEHAEEVREAYKAGTVRRMGMSDDCSPDVLWLGSDARARLEERRGGLAYGKGEAINEDNNDNGNL